MFYPNVITARSALILIRSALPSEFPVFIIRLSLQKQRCRGCRECTSCAMVQDACKNEIGETAKPRVVGPMRSSVSGAQFLWENTAAATESI